MSWIASDLPIHVEHLLCSLQNYARAERALARKLSAIAELPCNDDPESALPSILDATQNPRLADGTYIGACRGPSPPTPEQRLRSSRRSGIMKPTQPAEVAGLVMQIDEYGDRILVQEGDLLVASILIVGLRPSSCMWHSV